MGAPEDIIRMSADEKSALHDSDNRAADEILQIISVAEKNGSNLQRDIQDVIDTYGWTDWVAERLLEGLETVCCLRSIVPFCT